MKIKANVSINEQELADFLATALEGSFWAGVGVDNEDAYRACRKEDDCLEEHIARYMFLDPSNTIEIYDIEGCKKYTRHLNVKNIEDGFAMGLEKHYKVEIEEMDFYDADAILQFACFGELIFG